MRKQKIQGGGFVNGVKIYGYVRVSTKDQNEDRQVIALREFGVPKSCIVIEKASGKDLIARRIKN